MASNEKTKFYYWIKLKDSFMTGETVDFLMSQPNGAEYVVLYQMLCLKTANTAGALISQMGEIVVPYDINKIQRDTKYFKIDTIRVALELYKKLGLVFTQDSGILQISDFSEIVGCETKWAKYKRKQPIKKLKQTDLSLLENFQNNSNNNSNDFPTDFQQDIRDKSIDIRDKEIYNNPSSAGAREEDNGMKRFFDIHPKIQTETLPGNVGNIDFDLLTEKINNSALLKRQTSFSWLCKNWAKIKEGYFDDFSKSLKTSISDEDEKLINQGVKRF